MFGGFFAVYLLFNQLIDNHIRSEAQLSLNQEILTVQRGNTLRQINVPSLNDSTFTHVQMPGWMTSNQAIVTVSSIITDADNNVIHPNSSLLNEEMRKQVEALISFWYNNQERFNSSEEMVQVQNAGHSFYMRATEIQLMHFWDPNSTLEPASFWILMYTDVTPAMNLKNNMNQILLTLLGISGLTSLGSSIFLSAQFKKAIRTLSKHATIIGTGNFDEQKEMLGYAEFDELANSMNQMAEMLAAYESKQKQFFQNASHELRTPLTSIQGYTEGIEAGVFADTSVATGIILEESNKMKSLVDEILYLSQLSENEVEISEESIELNLVLKQTMQNIDQLGKNKEITIISSVEETAGISLPIGGDKLSRGLINILTNALRYAKREISVVTATEEKFVLIKIFNDGPEIKEEDLDFIFDRFYKGVGGNTGLGLAITKEIFEQIGGQIQGYNLDNGVEFEIVIPYEN